MKHYVVDGVDVFDIRQSWISTWQMCPEQARLDMRGELPRVETDATAVGTAVHTGIEAVLRDGLDYEDALQVAVLEFLRLTELENFRYVKAQTYKTAEMYVVNCFTSWYQNILPQLGKPLSIERNFKVQLDERQWENGYDPTPRRHRIMLSGTWDLDDSMHGLIDWKNKGAEIKRWEMDRWGVQPTVYTYAKRVLEGLPLTGDMGFTFVNMVKGPRPSAPQVLQVMRNENHYAWLKAQLWNIVDLYLATNNGETSWPMNDASWLCSERWCSAFAAGKCKGEFLKGAW